MTTESPSGTSSLWTQPEMWTGTRQKLHQSTGLDPAAYTDAGFFAVENERVFERAWVCVGIAADVVEPGRLLVRDVGSRSVIITRGNDGVLRGFLNSCRHRGTELASSDCDVANTIRCPYHRWGYNLEGTLVSTPFFEDVPRDDFDKADYPLVDVRVDTWGVLLFVCLDADTPDLEVWLGDLPERMAGYDLDSWVKGDEGDLTINANWKLISENFQEYYHLTWVHPELAKVSRVDDHYRYQGAGMYCGQTTTPVSGDDRDDWLAMPSAEGLDESDLVSSRFLAIFPNVLLSVLPNHVWVMRLDPESPGVTNETWTMLVPPSNVDGLVPPSNVDTAPDSMKSTIDFWIDVNNEDVSIVEAGQRGLTRGAVPAGPLAPRFEEPLHRFQNMLATHMMVDSMSDVTIPAGDRPGNADDLFGAGENPIPAAIDQR